MDRLTKQDGAVQPTGAGATTLSFGRYAGWTLDQIAIRDRNYLEWLRRSSGGRQYHDEIENLLRVR
ncbi:MAG: hypothetical protein LH650_11035 [Chloroflexi bacterium]|nr:hypothetical protein [Chloroflexota bacterium]